LNGLSADERRALLTHMRSLRKGQAIWPFRGANYEIVTSSYFTAVPSPA